MSDENMTLLVVGLTEDDAREHVLNVLSSKPDFAARFAGGFIYKACTPEAIEGVEYDAFLLTARAASAPRVEAVLDIVIASRLRSQYVASNN